MRISKELKTNHNSSAIALGSDSQLMSLNLLGHAQFLILSGEPLLETFHCREVFYSDLLPNVSGTQ